MTCHSDLILPAPTPDELLEARQAAGLSQQAAADLTGLSTRQHWWKLEEGKRPMSARSWALFLLATGQHPAYVLAPRPALPADSTNMPET